MTTLVCSSCNKSTPSSQCSACGAAFYCNERCQKNDWSSHKATCVEFAKRKRDAVDERGDSGSTDAILGEIDARLTAATLGANPPIDASFDAWNLIRTYFELDEAEPLHDFRLAGADIVDAVDTISEEYIRRLIAARGQEMLQPNELFVHYIEFDHNGTDTLYPDKPELSGHRLIVLQRYNTLHVFQSVAGLYDVRSWLGSPIVPVEGAGGGANVRLTMTDEEGENPVNVEVTRIMRIDESQLTQRQFGPFIERLIDAAVQGQPSDAGELLGIPDDELNDNYEGQLQSFHFKTYKTAAP